MNRRVIGCSAELADGLAAERTHAGDALDCHECLLKA
jgi:hypothetical protein